MTCSSPSAGSRLALPAASESPHTEDEIYVCTGGRATLTFWTRTATAQTGSGRLCVAVLRESTGQVLATADYTMPTWPSAVTQLAVSMDLAHITLAAGERMILAVRVPSDSGSDLQLLYDHPLYQSNLSLAMKQGGTYS